jgi:hypothetical protein
MHVAGVEDEGTTKARELLMLVVEASKDLVILGLCRVARMVGPR